MKMVLLSAFLSNAEDDEGDEDGLPGPPVTPTTARGVAVSVRVMASIVIIIIATHHHHGGERQ